MKLGEWEFNNYYSLSSDSMSYNLCIYQLEVYVEKETIDFFKYILQEEYRKIMTDKDVLDDIVQNFSSPVATIKMITPKNDNLVRNRVIPVPQEIIIKTKNLFCINTIPDINKVYPCSEGETIYSAIFKANLELKQIGFEIDLMTGLSIDYKI